MHPGGVVERHRVQRRVVGRASQGGDAGDVLVHERPVGHHRALGPRGRAGGVEQLDEVGVGHLDVDLRHLPRPGALEQRTGCVAERHHLLRRTLERVHLRGERGIDQRDPAARLQQEVRELLADEAVVDRHVHETRSGAGQEGDEVGVRVPAVRGDPVTLDEPEVEQDARRTAHRVVEPSVGPRPIGEPQRRPRSEAPRTAPHDVGHRARPRGIHGHGAALVPESCRSQFGQRSSRSGSPGSASGSQYTRWRPSP